MKNTPKILDLVDKLVMNGGFATIDFANGIMEKMVLVHDGSEVNHETAKEIKQSAKGVLVRTFVES